MGLPLVRPDGVVQHHPVVDEETVARLEEGAEVAGPDMLHHPDRGDAIELPLHLPVILLQDRHRQPDSVLAGEGDLFDRRADAGDLHVVATGRELGEATPAAADVEQPHSGLELELAADQVELCLLGGIEVVGIAPVRARVDHPFVEHPLEQVVADVVVSLGVLLRLLFVLAVAKAALQGELEQRWRRFHMVGEVRLLSDGEELIETVRRPPTLLVGLAQPQLPIADDPLVEPVVVNVDVGRAAAPDGHTDLLE